MRMVRIPESFQGSATNEHTGKLVVSLFMRYKVTSYIEVVAGELWCRRLSAQVYNACEDFLQL